MSLFGIEKVMKLEKTMLDVEKIFAKLKEKCNCDNEKLLYKYKGVRCFYCELIKDLKKKI